MATVQDLLDWLNQGGQGDIPGTTPGGPTQPAPQPSAPTSFESAAQPQGQQQQGSQDEKPGSQSKQAYQSGQKAGTGIWQALFGKPQGQTSGQNGQNRTITVDPDTMQNLSFTGLGNLLDQYHGIVGGTTPGNYAGDVAPKYLNYYNYLIQGGLPPDVAHQIITQPSYGEEQGQVPYRDEWPYAYAGHDQELSGAVSGQEPRDQGLADQVWQSIQNQIYGGWQQGT